MHKKYKYSFIKYRRKSNSVMKKIIILIVLLTSTNMLLEGKELNKKPNISKPSIYIIMEDTILDENKNKNLKAIAIIWKSQKEEVSLLLKKSNFKQGYTYTGNHAKDEYYNKYLPNIRIHAEINNLLYDYTPSLENCSLKVKILKIDKKRKYAKLLINATLTTKYKNYKLVYKKLSNTTYTIAGKEFIELEKLLK